MKRKAVAKTVARWSPNAAVRVKNRPTAARADRELVRVRGKHGRLTSQILVDESQPKDAVFHRSFTWNDPVAANNFRKQQARWIINSLEITIVVAGEVSAVAPYAVALRITETAAGPEGYTPMALVLSDPMKVERWLAMGRRELETWRRRYGHHKHFVKVVRAIEDTN